MTLNLTKVKLTPAQDKLWADTRVKLQWVCPAFTHVFYTMLDNTGSKDLAFFTEDEAIPIAATDGANLIFKPSVYFLHPLDSRVFIAAHEILHNIFHHVFIGHGFHKTGQVAFADGTKLPYIPQMMNHAADYVINDILMKANVGTMPKWLDGPHKGEQYGLWDTSIATENDAVLDVYKKIYEDADSKGNIQHVGWDELLAPGTSQGTDPHQATAQHNPAAMQQALAAGANAAKLQGKLPANLERIFGELLTPQVDWREHIQALFARKLGTGGRTWKQPDRRLIVRDIYAPGRSGFGAGCVVVAADTSGSIGAKELDMFMAEVSGILSDVEPKRLVIMWCDADVHFVDDYVEASDLNTIRHDGRGGGGGTDFRPVFDKIAEMGLEPEALVYLTDGEGGFPDVAPPYPCIWGSICPESKYPWGDVVQVPKQAA